MEDLLKYKTTKEALLYEKIDKNRVICKVCERRCEIPEGKTGFCRTRVNISGRLYTIYYGEITSLQSRPIEIKPFFHFYPGSTALTYSTWSCNLRCPWCQNNSISIHSEYPNEKNYISPESMVDIANKRGDKGICVSFNEPTLLFEHNLKTFKIAKRRGLYTCLVSNGYMTEEALYKLKEAGLDGIRIDIKGDKEVYKRFCHSADVDIVWRNARLCKEQGIHIEMINLVITDVNDKLAQIERLIDRHLEEVGKEVPLHFTRYFPSYRFKNKPTKIKTLEDAYKLAEEKGVLFPYLGNIPGHRYENTYCPRCKKVVIYRFGYKVVEYKLKGKRCPYCGAEIPISGEYIPR